MAVSADATFLTRRSQLHPPALLSPVFIPNPGAAAPADLSFSPACTGRRRLRPAHHAHLRAVRAR
eukprot:2511635-Pyramimonas_sp.AAC.1